MKAGGGGAVATAGGTKAIASSASNTITGGGGGGGSGRAGAISPTTAAGGGVISGSLKVWRNEPSASTARSTSPRMSKLRISLICWRTSASSVSRTISSTWVWNSAA